LQIVRDIKKRTGVDFTFRFVPMADTYLEASVDIQKKFIAVNSSIPWDRAKFISAILHEVSHIIAAKTGVYKIYHSWPVRVKNRAAFFRTALRAERYVDKYAKKMMKDLYPGVRYKPSYFNKKDVIWFNKQLKEIKEAWGF
jgi:hypothetical protein